MISGTVSQAIGIILVLVVVGLLFYRLGLSAKGNGKGKGFVFTSLALIGIGIFFSYEKYGALFGWKDQLLCTFTPENLVSILEMNDNSRAEYFYQLGAEADSYTYASNLYYCGAIGSNKDVARIAFPKEKDKEDYFHCIFTKKSLYEEVKEQFKNYEISVSEKGENEYTITDKYYMRDEGFQGEHKAYYLRLYKK